MPSARTIATPSSTSQATVGTEPADRVLMPVCVAIATVETLLAALFYRGMVAPLLVGLVHVAAEGVLAFCLSRAYRHGADLSGWLITLVATVALGPIGALGGALVQALAYDTSNRAQARLASWYERISLSTEIDDVTRLCDRVAIGRTMDLSATPPSSYVSLMENGSIAERQAILGLIARRFHPDYLPALAHALKSPEPVIRVQAAAVATRVQGEIRACLERAAKVADESGAGTLESLVAIDHIEAVVRSGLIDEGFRSRAASVLATLRTRASGRLDTEAIMAISRSSPGARQAVSSLERVLIDQRRFGDLRRLRRLSRISLQPRYRLRRLVHGGARRRETAAAASKRSVA